MTDDKLDLGDVAGLLKAYNECGAKTGRPRCIVAIEDDGTCSLASMELGVNGRPRINEWYDTTDVEGLMEILRAGGADGQGGEEDKGG